MKMKYNPDYHHRRSIRLKGYDYSSPGAYFVTICVYNRMILFNNPEIRNIIDHEWFNLSNRFGNIKLDEYVIMPNHFHAIIIINDYTKANNKDNTNLGSMVQAFKSITTLRYLKSKIPDRIDMPGKLWQRNYYEHIIRDDDELYRIREYIRNNPLNWETDPDNPMNF